MGGEEKYFLGRQPILDRSQQLVGYELLFRSADTLTAGVLDSAQASASVILNALADFGIRDVLGRNLGFFNVSEEILMDDALLLLHRDQVVIELLETIPCTPEVVERCRALKGEGFTLALDDHLFSPDFVPLYETVDVVKLDVLATPASELYPMVGKLRSWPLRLLAEKVETAEQHGDCMAQGFELFQGYYFARPVVLKKNRADIGRLTLVRLFNQLLAEAELSEIEETFRQNPNLTFSLLRMVNSVAFGCKEKIRTLRHAITVMGIGQLRRWIMLALFASREGKGGGPLLEVALMRARLMETLARYRLEMAADREFVDRAFMTGVLSLVDVLLETTMTEAVAGLNLSDDVRQALLGGEGVLGSLLRLADHLVRTEFEAVIPLMAECRLELGQLVRAQRDAVLWTNALRASA